MRIDEGSTCNWATATCVTGKGADEEVAGAALEKSGPANQCGRFLRRRRDVDGHERLADRALGRVDEPHLAVGAGRGHGRAVGRAGDRIDSCLRHFELPCLLSTIGLIAADLAAAIEAAGCEEPRAVGVEPRVVDAAGHRFVFANLVRVAAAGRRSLDIHLEKFRRAVGPAHDNLVPLGVPIDRLHAAAEDARRVRRQVADESLRGHIRHLDRHIAAGREQRLAVGGKHGAANPVIVGRHVHDLLEGLGIERPQGVIGPADGDQLAVGRPTAAVQGIETDHVRCKELVRSNVPHLDLAAAAGIAARDEQLRSVARETYGFDSIRHAHQPRDAGRSVGLPKKHLVKAGHGKQFAVRREIERRDHGAVRIDGRMIGIERLAAGCSGCRLPAPSAIQRRMRSISPAASGGRPCGISALPSMRADQLQQLALLRLAGNDRRRSAFAAAQQAGQGGHLVAALGFGRLMAAIAIGLQQRLDLFAIADLAAGLTRFGERRCPVAVEGDRRNREDCDQDQEPLS